LETTIHDYWVRRGLYTGYRQDCWAAAKEGNRTTG
jgi:hypothetical protein